MKTTTMKGNHELVHLAPPLRRGGGKRPQLNGQNGPQRTRLHQNGRHRQCDPARVDGERQTAANDGCPPAPDHSGSRSKLNGRMEPRTIQFIAGACAGELLSAPDDLNLTRVCTDSRQVQAGDLFIALRRARFDGHDFLDEVIRKGARAIVVQRDRLPAEPKDCPTIIVPDTRKALGNLATRYRADFSLPFIAVGGSNGKTTTKELIASVLHQKLVTLASEG